MYALLTLATLSLPAFAQQLCHVDLIYKPTGRIVLTYTEYSDPGSCQEEMKQCRKAIRFDYSNHPSYPSSALDYVPIDPRPVPQPQPQPQPNPGNIPYEVSRMSDIEQAVHFALQDCHVIPRVSGWANQLVINRSHAGMQDPCLIQDFANFQYCNCHVKLNVSG